MNPSKASATSRTTRYLGHPPARQKDLPREALAAMNDDLSGAFPALRLVPAEKGGVIWGWGGDEDAL